MVVGIAESEISGPNEKITLFSKYCLHLCPDESVSYFVMTSQEEPLISFQNLNEKPSLV